VSSASEGRREEDASARVLEILGKPPGMSSESVVWSMVGRGGARAPENLPVEARGCVLEWCLLMHRAAEGNQNRTGHKWNGLF